MSGSEKLYNVWYAMIQRCHNPDDPSYRHYGAKGISVCDEWRNDYKVFKEWALSNGYKPTPHGMSRKWILENGLSIDRIDPCGGYAPNNCQWIPFIENLRKLKRTSIQGFPKKQNVFLRMPDKLKGDLQVLAKQERESLNEMIVSILWAYAESKPA